MKRFGIDWFTALLAAFAALAGGLILLRTNNYGAAIAGDSLLYLSVAENLLDGNGFVAWNTKRIYSDGAPLFSLALAGVGLFGVEILEAARYLNAAAFGLTVFVTALWLRCRVVPHFLVLWSACACALPVFLSTSAASVMTEPLFLLFTTLSLFTLDGFLDTRRRSFLLAAAASAALAWLTRYIGVTLVASALLLLLLQGRTAFPTRIRYAALYAIIAGAPVGLWMLRNVLHTGMPLGVVYPTGFSLLSSLHVASDEFIGWMIGENASRLLGARLAEIVAGIIEGDAIVFTSLKVGFLLAVASGVGYALIRLRRRGYAQSWSIWAVPAAFASIYGAFLAFHLPLTDVNLPTRYLAPLYVPLLVAATLFLNEVLRCVAPARSLAMPSFLRKWSGGAKTIANGPALALTACLSLWLFSHSYENYSDIRHWVNNGYGYASRQWRDSSTVRYLDNYLHHEYVWSNNATSIQFLLDTPGRNSNKLPYARPTPDNLRRWLGIDGWVSQFYPYIVWFHSVNEARYDYDLAELAALPGVQVEAVLEDGVVFKAVGPRIGFHVSYDENENKLIYVRENCRAEDLEARFFLHVFPMDKADLPDSRRRDGFEHLDFHLDRRVLYLDGRCVAVRDLPDYPIGRIHTGQFTDVTDEGRIWRVSLDPSDDAEPRPSYQQIMADGPIIRADFDVYLDDYSLIYVKEGCRTEDLDAPVFLHVFPMDKADLPDSRRRDGFEHLDFHLDRRVLYLDGRCIAVRDLPDYTIARVDTGQFTDEGQIWRVWLDPSDDAEPHPSYQKIMADGPIIRADFDLYLDDYRLIYVKEGCRAEDFEAGFFLHVFPMDKADLPDSRRRDGFDNLDFHPGRRVLYLDGRCIAVRDLPDYAIARVDTGQYTDEGRIWSVWFDPSDDAEPHPSYQKIMADGPIIRADFDLYLDDYRLIYVKEGCRAEDVEAGFFLHVFPMDRADLPDSRRRDGFDNLDFHPGRRVLYLDGRCIAVRDLPDYAIARVDTGQYTDEGRIWSVWFDPSDDAEPRLSYQQVMADGPIIRAGFDVYMDDHRLIYVKEGCRAEDVEARVFLHVFPMDKADLPDSRRRYGFDNLDFHLDRRVLYLDGRCVAERDLPDYPIGRIRTGQFIQGQGRLWTSEFSPD